MVLQVDGMDGLDWISPGGVMYRAPYSANKSNQTNELCATKLKSGLGAKKLASTAIM